MRSRIKDKAISLLLTINLVFNSFAPFLTFARPVVSAEPLKAEVDFKTLENSFDISVNTKEEIEYVLSWKNQDGAQGTSITKAGGDDQEFQRDIYAGIKSGPDARRDTVIRGIYKVEVKSQHWITAIKFSLDDGKLIDENKKEYNPSELDFTEEELKWIEEGDQVTPTPTLEATAIPTPTIVEQGDILEGVSDQNFMTPDVDGVVQTNVIESYQCRADSLNGCLTTDKEDYAPTEVALITGYGFAPNTEYIIRIFSSDEPAVTYEASVTTDEHGSFTVSYQLDGTYRPNYLVQLFDLNGHEVARVTFTDSALPSDTKLNQWETKNSGKWITGALQSNNSNYKEGETVPFELELGKLETSGNPYTFSVCRDYQNGGHFGYIALQPYNTSRSALPDGSISTTNSPFSGSNISSISFVEVGGQGACGSGQRETQLTVNIINGNENSYLLWGGKLAAPGQDGVTLGNGASSYPGGSLHMSLLSPSKDVGIQTSAIIPGSTITINKVTSPVGGTGFGFLSTGLTPSAFNLNDGQTQTYLSVIPGSYSISENDPSGLGYSLTGLSCSTIGTGSSTITNTETRTANITIGSAGGATVNCTYTNTIENGSITVTKQTTPEESPQSFTFNLGGDATDSTSLIDGQSHTFSNLLPGNYTLSEIIPTGWQFAGATCDNTSFTNGGSINLSPGENVSCVFNNTQLGTMIVKKVMVGGTDTFDFTDDVTGSISSSNGTIAVNNVIPGSYSSVESVKSGWELTNISCDDTNSSADIGTRTASFNVEANETVTCTFTNTKIPKLTVIKVVTNDNGGNKAISDFPLFVDGNPVTSGVANSLTIGAHIVSETTDTKYSSIISGDCDINGNITLAAGDNKTCTITNNDNAPSLGLRKTITKDNGGQNNETDWTLTATGTGDTPTNLSGTTPVNSGSNFKADTYTLGETGPSGYSAGNWICTGEGTQVENTITLGLGESAICTINNDDQPGRLIVKKVLVQDDGGDEDYEDFSFKVNGGSSIDFESDGQNEITVNSGTYTVVEDTAAGYDTSYSNCTDVFVPNGGSATCTITNDDIAPTLKLKKIVLGSVVLTSGDWDLTASGEAGFTDSGDSTTFHEVMANEPYTLSETVVDGYTAGNWSCDNAGVQGNVVALGLNDEVTCTITNTRDTGNIQILKLIDADGDLTTTGDRTAYEGWVVDVDQDGNDTDDPTLPVTDSEGKSSATGIKTGEYWVSEGSVQGYKVLSGSCMINDGPTGDGGEGKSSFGGVTVAKDTTTYCTFINAPDSTLHGYKWHDEDISGGPEAGIDEDLLGGWTIYLYKAIDEDVYSLVDSMVTDNNLEHFGWYWFENLVPGDYRICEENQAGWNQTYPINDINNCHEVSLPLDSSGEMITREVLNAVSGPMYNFGNISLGKVNVTKYNDLNGNGMRDDGEPTLPDWEMVLSGMDTVITDENGLAEFDGVVPGDYILDEVIQDGWEQTAITCSVPVDPTPTPTTPVNLTGTPTPTPVLFNNICHWNEGADKWNALSIPDSNKGHDDHEMDYPYGGNVDSKGHPVKDSHHKDDPELNGDAWCEANRPDQRASALGFGIGTVKAVEVQIDGYEVTVEPGKIVNCEIGNRQINPELQISKSNDADGDRSSGDTVVYTLRIKALTSQVLGVILKDLLPDGFTFQNVISIIKNGTDDLTEMVGNPNYSSPGTYNLGDMNADDEIVIKYTAKVGDVSPGRYKDLAYATGYDVLNNRVIAQAQTDGYVSNYFVGTSVNINANLTQSGNISIEGEVLGASTFLPATGGDAYWIIMAALLTIMGLLFMILGFLVNRKKLVFKVFGKIVAGIALTGLFIFTPVVVEAAPGDLSIRLEQAKSPTSINEFSLTYVVMDLSESPAPIRVRCFKKGPSDGGYIQFGSTQDVSAGGNSGKCEVTPSIVSSSGTYQFYVTANNGTDSATSESEGIVSVGYNTVGDPVPPVTYKKEKISSCQYKITFKTADDGKTERVEIYRSETTSFKLDGSTRIADIAIGPNQTSDFVQSVPDCEKNYYYAMRSFNSAGNPSGPVGDSVVTVTTALVSETGETSSAIQVINVTLPGGAQGEVLGEDKEATESPSAELDKEEVKGASAVAEKLGDFAKTNRNYIIGLLGLIIAVTVYVLIKKRKKTIDF